MRAKPANAHDPNVVADAVLSPERRLAAVADILARGLARVLLAEENASHRAHEQAPQLPGNTSESALINGVGDALMVPRGEEQQAAKGGPPR